MRRTTRAFYLRLAALSASMALAFPGAADAANVSGVSASPNPFNPNTAQTTTVSYNLNNAALLWLRVYNGSDAVQRRLVTPGTFTSTNRAAGARSETWDGKNDSNAILADGLYPYSIDNAWFSADLTGAGSNPHDVAVDASNPSVIWQTNKTSPYVYKSTNGGGSWTGVSGTGASAKAYGIAVSADGQKIYLTDDGQTSLNMSTNGGSSWTTSGALPGGSVADVTTSADGTIVYVINYSSGAIYKSANNGTSFSTCTASGYSANGPRGIATDAAGTTVIVLNSGNNTVYKSTNGCSSFSQLTAIGSGAGAGQVSYPYQAAIQSDGKFWVSERDNHRIQQFDASGNSLMVIGGTASGSGNYQFNSGSSYFGMDLAAVSGEFFVFVADYNNTRVKKLGYDNWSSSTPLQIASAAVNSTTAGSASASRASATSISVSMPYTNDANGNNTYTVDYKLSSSATWSNWVTNATHSASPYATTITGLTTGETYDVRLTYNDADTVGGTNPQTVTNITLLTNSTAVGSASASAASSTSIGVSMPYTHDANSSNTYTVEYKLSSSGTWITWVTGAGHVASPYTTAITGLSPGQTYDVRVTYTDADGVSGSNPQTVAGIVLPSGASNVGGVSASPTPFNPNNAESTTISYTLGTDALLWLKIRNSGGIVQKNVVTPGSFASPNKNAGANGDVWNGRNASNTILADGQYPYTIDDAFFSTHLSGPGSNPHDIAVDPSNPSVMWMLDKTSPYVYKSTNGGSSWSGVAGTSASAKANAIALSADGQKIFIAEDTSANLKMSTNGGSSWTTSASFPSAATHAVDVAVSDNGNIVYALDYSAKKIYKSTNAGTSWSTCGATGLTLGASARGIATNATGTVVLVADSSNNDIYRSDDSCGFFFSYGYNSGTASGNLSYPYQIAIQSDGKFWVSERDNHRIQQFDASGNVLMTFGGTASGAGNFQFNSGASSLGLGLGKISTQTSVLVADYNNNRVKVVGYDNWSSATHTTIASVPPSAPSALSAGDTAADNGGSIGLSWTVSADTGIAQQRIYRSTASGSGYALLTTISNNTTNTYTDTTAATGTTYYYVARAYNGAQESANSNQASAAAVDNIVPNAPAGLTATIGNAEVSLSWTPSNSTDTTQQRIYRSTTSGSGYGLIHTINNNTTGNYNDTAVSNGTTYYYVVRAYNGVSESASSNQASATPTSNTLPVASNGTLYGRKDTTATGVLIAADADEDALTYSLVSNGALGTATITNAATGAYRYVPNAGVTGNDSITFRVHDGKGYSNIATISISITAQVAGTTLGKGWNMVSFPTHLAQKSDFYTLLIDDLGAPPMAYKWASAGTAGSFNGDSVVTYTAQPGKGYWLYISTSSTAIDDEYNGEHAAYCDAVNFPGVQCVDVALQPGGNMVGNPYAANKDLLQSTHVKVCNSTTTTCTAAGHWVSFTTAVTNGWILNTIYRYNPTSELYDNVKSVVDGAIVMAPWQGWWVRVQTSNNIVLRFYK